MTELTSWITDLNSFVWGTLFLIPLLCGTGIFYTLRLRFVQVWLTDSDGQGAWVKVDNEGVQVLHDWIVDDYSLLTEKPAHSRT